MRDEQFLRGQVPMTKSEVRAVSLSKLEVKADSVVYDVGAGTGSVSVEAAFAAPAGHVYAFEQKEEACRLIGDNIRKFGVANVTVVPGRAPDTFAGIPAPDRVFLGGTGGNLEAVLDQVRKKNPRARIVANVIALETLGRVMEYLRQRGLAAEIICMQVSRAEKLGPYHMMKGGNPIYIVTVDPEAQP